MEIHQKPKATPVLILKAIGLSLSMGLGLVAAFFAGYNKMPYILPPCIFLEMACYSSLLLLSRYLRGILLREPNSDSVMGSFWLGCVLLVLSVAGCIFYGIVDFVKIDGLDFKDYELYAALASSLLAVFWSAVLVYDAKNYWRMWQRETGNAGGRIQMGVHNPGYF